MMSIVVNSLEDTKQKYQKSSAANNVKSGVPKIQIIVHNMRGIIHEEELRYLRCRVRNQ